MATGETEIARHRAVAWDDKTATVSVANNATDVTILSYRTPPGLRGWIAFFGQAWDSGMDTFVDYTLKVNGGIPAGPWNKSKVQISPPESPERELPAYIPVQGNSLIEVVANMAVGGTTGNFTARVISKYTDPLEDKRP